MSKILWIVAGSLILGQIAIRLNTETIEKELYERPTTEEVTGLVRSEGDKINRDLVGELGRLEQRLSQRMESYAPTVQTANVLGGDAPETFVQYPDGSRAYVQIDSQPVEQYVQKNLPAEK